MLFDFTINDLVEGEWQVSFLMVQHFSSRTNEFSIISGGSTLLGPDYNIHDHVNDNNPGSNPEDTMVIEQQTITVSASNTVTFTFNADTRSASISALGMEYVGP